MTTRLAPSDRRARVRFALAFLALGMPSAVAGAQAVCSAPHSSPTLAGGGGIGTLPVGTGWAMISGALQTSRSAFDSRGDRRPFLADGKFRSTSAYLSAGVGIVRGVDVWAQVPVHRMRYIDVGGHRTRSGIGDARMALRLSPDLVGYSIPVALRLGVKLPGSTFPVDATVIPLTEGQRDTEVSLETGRAFGAGAFYVFGWSGYRWRNENRKAARKPGDESFTHVAVGFGLLAVRLELGADLLVGRPPRQLGFELPAARRRLFQIAPTVARKVGMGDLEFTAVIPIVGRNLPTGTALSAGYRIRWGDVISNQPRMQRRGDPAAR